MGKAIAILLGAVAFQLATAAAETRSGEIGDIVRLLLFVGAVLFFASALPSARVNARQPRAQVDARFSGFGGRVVTLTLRGETSHANRMAAE